MGQSCSRDQDGLELKTITAAQTVIHEPRAVRKGEQSQRKLQFYDHFKIWHTVLVARLVVSVAIGYYLMHSDGRQLFEVQKNHLRKMFL